MPDQSNDYEAGSPATPQGLEQGGPAALRVLVVTQYFWPETFLINDVVKRLESNNCDVTVLTGQPNYPEGRIYNGYSALKFGKSASPGDYELIRVPVVPRGNGAVRRVANYLSFVVTASTFGAVLLRQKQFDVVFVYAVSPIFQALPAIFLARRKKAALVVWVQDLWPDTLKSTEHVTNPRILRTVGRLTRYIYRQCDLILAQSNGFVAKIRQLCASPVPVRVQYNPGQPVDPEIIADGPRLPDGFCVVFAGNLGTAQSLETIVEAARLLVSTQCRFIIVGSGSRSEWLKGQIARLNLENIHLLGRFPNDIMPAIFNQASALMVTLARSDNLALTIPSKIPSYLAAGKPIVASLDGEAAEIIARSGAGIAVPAEDAVALADAIRRLMALPQSTREQMGRAGQDCYRQFFEPDRLAKKMKSYLEQAVRSYRSGAVSRTQEMEEQDQDGRCL